MSSSQPAVRPVVPSVRLGPRIAVLKEGSERKQGAEHAISNAAACQILADVVRVTLGPLGHDILLVLEGGKQTITNDGATIMSTLNVKHPAARLLVEMSQSQDKAVGDGTTSIVILASEVLTRLTQLLSNLNHPHSISAPLSLCHDYCVEVVKEHTIDTRDDLNFYLYKSAVTTLSSKLIAGSSDHFANIAIQAIKAIGVNSSLKLVGIKNEFGGSIQDSILVDGFAIPKCFSYAGAKMQPYSIKEPKIALLNIELELKAERSNAEVKISSAQEYQAIIDTEWDILFEKLDKIVKSGANVVLSQLPVGDVAYQYFADRQIYCGGRVAKDDMERAELAFGAFTQASLDNLAPNLGQCQSFEEISIGSERYIKFSNPKGSKSCTIILRGVGEMFVDESKRSLHDALKVVQNIYNNPKVVVGGGAIEMTLSTQIRKWANKSFKGKNLIFLREIAKAFEIIPSTLAVNCGYDQTTVISELRKAHDEDEKSTMGIDITSEQGIGDNLVKGIFEPQELTLNKLHTIFESVIMLLLVNQTIKAPRLQSESQDLMNAKRAIMDK